MSTTTTTAFEDALRQIDRGESLETAVEALLAHLTPEEKLWLLDGDQEFWPAIAEMSQAYNARPIDTEDDIQLLQRHIVDDLIISTLQESGVYRTKRYHAVCGQAGRKSNGMLFSNAYIKNAGRHFLLHPGKRASR